MKLDTDYLPFITKDEVRVLTAIEMGMKNHEIVPVQLIERISSNKRANTFKVLKTLQRNRLVYHENKKYDGYKLTVLGYDYLALLVLNKRGHIKKIISKIGVGKESDIYKCVNDKNESVILKLTRLGRNSFRTVKKNRDYLGHRTQFNWLYLSRLSAQKEFEFMVNLYENGFSTPRPIDQNRHTLVMELVKGVNLNQITTLDQQQLQKAFDDCINNIISLMEYGLIHCDFNEFNIMMEEQTDKIVLIDFPQMVSRSHLQAAEYFERDLDCVNEFFFKRFRFQKKVEKDIFHDIEYKYQLDQKLKASGYNHQNGNVKDDVLQLYYKSQLKKSEDEQQQSDNDQQQSDNEQQQSDNDQQQSDNDQQQSDNDDQQDFEINEDEFKKGINSSGNELVEDLDDMFKQQMNKPIDDCIDDSDEDKNDDKKLKFVNLHHQGNKKKKNNNQSIKDESQVIKNAVHKRTNKKGPMKKNKNKGKINPNDHFF